MAQLPGGHKMNRAASFSAPSPSGGPAPSANSTADAAGPNGTHPTDARSGMPLPGGYPYPNNMGPPQPAMRRPSTSTQGNGGGGGGMSPQQQSKPLPYAYAAHTGAAEGGYQYPPVGSYSNQQQWNNNAAMSPPASWASSPPSGYSGYTHHPQGALGPQQGSSNTSNGQGVSVPGHRSSQSSMPAPIAVAPLPYATSRAPAPSRTASFAAADSSSSNAAAASWGGAHPPQSQQANSAKVEVQDAKQVMDVLGGSGIDLRAEEEAMRGRDMQHHGGHSIDAQPQRTMATGSNLASYPSKQDQEPPISSLPYLQLYPLASFVHAIASTHEIGVEPDVLSTLSTGARIRFRNLLDNMIASSRQRCWSSHERPPPLYQSGEEDAAEGPSSGKKRKPMYHQQLISDPSKWLAAIEKADRGEEIKARRRRAQRQKAAMLAAASSDSTAQGGTAPPGAVDGEGDESMTAAGEIGPATPGSEGAGGRKKGKVLSAKNISEDVRRRLANNTAARALGGATTPKWMMMGTGSSPASSGFSTPTRTKTEGVKADEITASAAAAAAEVESSSGAPAFGPNVAGLSSLPKPRFAPAAQAQSHSSNTASAWTRGLAPSGLAGTPLSIPSAGESGVGSASGKINPQGWGDLAARALAKEEEEKRKRKRVNLQDVYHAVETERRSGIGSGAGEKTVWRWRCLGAEAARKSSSSSAAGSSGSGTTSSGTGTSK